MQYYSQKTSGSYLADQARRLSPGRQESQHSRVQDSTGLNFDFKEKLQDSSQSIAIEDLERRQNGTMHYQKTVSSNYIEAPLRANPKSTVLFDNPGDQRAQKLDASSKMRIASSREQVEFGDASDKQEQLVQQNRELKDLVMKLQKQIEYLQADKFKLEKELNNIMDPLSKSSQLKEVPQSDQKYKEVLKAKDQKLDDLEKENYALKSELREANAVCSEAKARLDGIESRHIQQVYDLKLQLENKARLQMVASGQPRSPTLANCRLPTRTQTQTKR